MIIESRLGDLVNIRTGKLDANASSDNGKYPFFTCSIMPLRIDNYSYDCECVLVAGNGDLNVKYYNGKFDAYQRTYIIEVKDKLKVNTKYLYYYMSKYIEVLRNQSIGGVIKYIKLANLTEAKIPIISLDKQIKIIEILDLAQMIIEKRKKSIELLDELVKSKFIEMFGDPVTNLKKWDKVAIGEMFEIKTGATPSRKENSYWEGGTIPWVKTTELKEYIINETEEYITEDGFNNSSVNLLPKDTILIAMYGQGKTRGMTGKLGIEATTNQACAAILPNNNENMDFVWYQLRLLYDELRALGQGGSQPNLNTNLVKTYQLIFPPVELQNEFERFIKHIDKLKFEMEHSLKELEDNFNSLMQKAFKGELFN
ncbi:restriction endonuclease subunit S [Clostridium perfringens]